MRTTASEIKDILDTELSDARIEAFIQAASDVVTGLLSNDFDEPILTNIERWLTAHYIAVTVERRAIQEIAGPVEQKFSDIYGQNLQATDYGQVAASLDTTGKLASIGRRRIFFRSINEG
jgi:hypothetical protein